MKIFFRKILSICLALSFIVTMGTFSFADSNTAYWHETSRAVDDGSYSDWMGNIKDNEHVSEISIPGTHDSMAFKSNLPFVDNVRTQSMDLKDQLESGIRYIDIRVAYEKNKFTCHHGFVNLGYDLDDVINTVSNFLSQHPSETVFMRFKQEYTSANDYEMKNLFDKYLKKYSNVFWNPYESKNYLNPTLGELRGKICLISDVLSIQNGLSYRNIYKQDNYNLNSNWDLYSKWEKVKEYLNYANLFYKNYIILNHLSGSGGAFPYFVASGKSNPKTYAPRLLTGYTEPAFRNKYPDFPRVARFGVFSSIAFEGTNELTSNYINNNMLKHTGFIVSDFPGKKLITSVINANFR